MSIIPNCLACKHRDVEPEGEPCNACLHNAKGIVASKFEEREVEK